MIRIRKSEDRGHANHGWLDSHHSFSFSDYYDPRHMGFRDLRVINEDRVVPGRGFPTHGHRDMEIVSYVLDGALEHKDSLGTGSVIRPGDVQRMSAGRGVRHSEFNASREESVHFLQIWILPESEGGDPGYEQKHFPREEKLNRLRLVASPSGEEGSVKLRQDARILASVVEPGREIEREIAPGRHVWVQVARGDLEVNGEKLKTGDGAALSDEKFLRLKGLTEAEVLVFDLR